MRRCEHQSASSLSTPEADLSRRELLHYGTALPVVGGILRGPADTLRADIQQKWSKANDISSTPVFSENRIFGITREGVVLSADLESGVTGWTYSLGRISFDDAIALIDGRLFAGSSNGRLVSIEPSTGEIHWQRTLGTAVLGFETDGENLLVSTKDSLLSLIPTKGTIRWKTSLNMHTTAASSRYRLGAVPAVQGNYAFVRTQNEVVAVATSNGQVIWRQDIPMTAYGDPFFGSRLAVTNENVFAVSNLLRAFDIRTGEIQWSVEFESVDGRFEHHRWGLVSPVTDGKHVFTGIENVQAFDIETGTVSWTIGGLPAFMNSLNYHSQSNTLYLSIISDRDMEVVSVKADTGIENWRTKVGRAKGGYVIEASEMSRPVVHNTAVYVTCRGTLLSLQESGVEFETATPSNDQVQQDVTEVELITEGQSTRGEITRTATNENQYRGLISNNPQRDIGAQYGDIYTLTVVSTVLSLAMMIGQLITRRRK